MRTARLLALATVVVCVPGWAISESCTVAAKHVGLIFPVEKLSPEWACRMQAVIDHYTTANKVGPARTALAEPSYLYLLDRPPLAAALINRLDLGLYKSETRSPGRFWGSDGEGTEGIVQLIYQDRTSRIYYLDGTHHSGLLPNISGKAVVFLRMTPVNGANGQEEMENTIVSYTRLDSRVLAGMVSLIRPLVGTVVARKLVKGVETVNRLGLEMQQHPDRVLFEATDPPPLPDEDVAFLKRALAGFQQPGRSGPKSATTK